MIHDAYVRAVPPGSTVSAAFMMIHNPTATLRAVVAATSPAARTVELHTHVDDGGVMRMRQVERIDVPAHGMATLAPGGYHIMLIDLVAPLAEGTTAPVELVFDADGSTFRDSVTLSGSLPDRSRPDAWPHAVISRPARARRRGAPRRPRRARAAAPRRRAARGGPACG